jgi:hypothetical protein
MQKLAKPATAKNPPEQFTGVVWPDPIASPHDADQRMVVALVTDAEHAAPPAH